MRHAIAGLVAVALPALAAAQPPTRYVAGEHYTALPEPVETGTGERIEVVEFFVYGCPHCYNFEPQLEPWVAGLPEDVAFRRVPATFGSQGQVHARIFYTAKVLGVLDEVHDDIFDAIHEQGRPLLERADIREFFVEHGVDGASFDETFDSSAVDNKVNAATVRMQAHRVTSVPSLGIDGRYWVNNRQAGDHAAMLEIADFLIERERSDR